jgi:type I restriction enzyme R subunit
MLVYLKCYLFLLSTPAQLWQKYCAYRGFTEEQLPLITQDYHDDGSGKAPRYYQLQAINKTIEAVSQGKNRMLLVMATGTGKLTLLNRQH